MIRPQMRHASLSVLAESRSIAPEQASPARDLVLPVVVRPVLFNDNFHVTYQHDKAGRGVSQSVYYFHFHLFKYSNRQKSKSCLSQFIPLPEYVFLIIVLYSSAFNPESKHDM